MSLLSSRWARRGRFQGTRGWSASSQALVKGDGATNCENNCSPDTKHKKVLGSVWCGFMKGKSCFTKLVAFCEEITD